MKVSVWLKIMRGGLRRPVGQCHAEVCGSLTPQTLDCHLFQICTHTRSVSFIMQCCLTSNEGSKDTFRSAYTVVDKTTTKNVF